MVLSTPEAVAIPSRGRGEGTDRPTDDSLSHERASQQGKALLSFSSSLLLAQDGDGKEEGSGRKDGGMEKEGKERGRGGGSVRDREEGRGGEPQSIHFAVSIGRENRRGGENQQSHSSSYPS